MFGKVSVIIPTVNRASLKRTLESIFSQTYKNLEVIVVDDSQDQSLSLGGGSEVVLLKTGGLKGPSIARNEGLSFASGNWIAFCDDDDTWEPTKILEQLTFANENGLDAVFTSATEYSPKARPRPNIHLETGDSPIAHIYRNSGLFRNKSYLPMAALLIHCDYAHIRFEDKYFERENLLYYQELFKVGAKMGQMKIPLTNIFYKPHNSIRRIDFKIEKNWLNYLDSCHPSASNTFAVESARNFIRIGNLRSAFKMTGLLVKKLFSN